MRARARHADVDHGGDRRGRDAGGVVPRRVAGHDVLIGNTALMEARDVRWSALEAEAEGLRGRGASVMFVAVGKKLAGLSAVSDPPGTTHEAIAACTATASASSWRPAI